ncbi:sulfatase family protein [Catenovulum adriaticum]|uniref:Sulfatase n=1 Tax=Catenovulum adriaticum TaxID=2984846 RepID=A0ABY7AU54_9ALTE|nr:sulfatase [Catenovulum sp. TS8]WAJ71801.1 sulfatase [Catenovulum sp. TS8]
MLKDIINITIKKLIPLTICGALISCSNSIELAKTKSTSSNQAEKPNIIVVFTDDQGYADLSSYGADKIKTPNLDKFAQTGLRFTDFYVASSVCSASRAALLTGKLPKNNGVTGVYFPDAMGMKPEQITLAEMLKPAGYRTAAIGKWHLGDLKTTLPTAQGFDYYYGIPYSNDMYIGYKHEFAEQVKFNQGYSLEKARADQAFVQQAGKKRNLIRQKGLRDLVPIFEGDKIVEYPAEQSTLTKRYFEKAIEFIDSSSEPFFVYLTPAMPHVPLFASEEFRGKSAGGLYGDTVEEIDHYFGKLIHHLKQTKQLDNTLIVFSSDNGPWLGYGSHAGSAKPFSYGKFTNYEGGIRVPGIMSMPSKIKANQVTGHITSTIDLAPTILQLAGIDSAQYQLDGTSLVPLFDLKQANQPIVFLSYQDEIAGVRYQNWKYIKKGMNNVGKSGRVEDNATDLLFDLSQDPTESTNLIEKYPYIKHRLDVLIDEKQN